MITPGLWRRALSRGAQWRLLLLYVVVLAVPAALALLPVWGFVGGLLNHSTRAHELVRVIDSNAAITILQQLESPGSAVAISGGVIAALLVTLLLGPFLAGASLAAARAEVPLPFRELLGGAGETYGRLLRMAIVAALPFGIAGGIAAGAFKLAKNAGEKAILETTATLDARLAMGVALIFVLLAHVTLEAGRAHFAAQPQRRSAFLAWWRGVVLLVRHPLRVLGLCLVTGIAGLGLAALLMVAHLHVHQTSAGTVLLAFVLAQLAIAAVAWDRSSRLIGLSELVRADAAARAQAVAARFEMAPPRTSPPAPSALSPMEAGLVAEQTMAASEPPFASPNPESPLLPAYPVPPKSGTDS